MHPTKENLLKVVRDHKKPDWTPTYFDSCFNAGLAGMDLENGPPSGGNDAFGVTWLSTPSAGSGLTTLPGKYVLDDITRWKEVVQFPDVWSFDWESYAQRAYPPFFNDETMLRSFSVSGPFQRMYLLMGFENCLCDMAMEPEATYDFMSAVADYNIEMMKAAKKHLKLDIFDLAEDMATGSSLFMSPDTYRELIKPHHRRIFEAARNEGLIVEQHTCGKADAIADDLVELGVDIWQSVQPINDMEAVLQKYSDRLALVGGFDSIGEAARTADPDVIRREVRRCYDTYGKYDGFVFWGFLLMDDPKVVAPRMQAMIQEGIEYPRKIKNLL